MKKSLQKKKEETLQTMLTAELLQIRLQETFLLKTEDELSLFLNISHRLQYVKPQCDVKTLPAFIFAVKTTKP